MTTLRCPSCKTPFVPENVNLALGVASCGACGTVHDLSARRGTQHALSRSPVDPTGLVIEEGRRPSVRWSWRTWQIAFFVVWCTFWDLGMLAMVASAVSTGAYEMLLFGSLHITAGAAVTYYLLALIFNSTTVAVSDEEVTVAHGPLPWFGGRAVARADVAQFYVVEVRGNKGSRSWTVFAELGSGHRTKLVGGLSSPGRARFLEDWLEQKTGVEDRPVDGEHA